MSIKDIAYQFHTKTWDSPNREEIRAVVAKLSSSSRGYGNTVYPAQILGLLLYDQEKFKKLEGRAPVEELSSWTQRELHILLGVHDQVRLFNERCLARLKTELPQCVNAVNPYKPYPMSTHQFKEFLFQSGDAKEVIESFHRHPAFEIALSTLASLKDLRINYDETVWQVNNEIVNAGPGEESEWVAEFDEARRWGNNNLGFFRHVGALVCLHNALANLDELIYLGLFEDELPHLGRNQIIDFTWTTAGAGPSMWLLHIPAGFMFLFEPTDLITVNIDRPGEKGALGDKLCQIHSQSLPLSMSRPGMLRLRMIDDNLSGYPYLLI